MDLAKIPDLTPLLCTCGRIMQITLYVHPYTKIKHAFVFCPNAKCRQAKDYKEYEPEYNKVYKRFKPFKSWLHKFVTNKNKGEKKDGLRKNPQSDLVE